MSEFNCQVTPLNRRTVEATPEGGKIEYEDFGCTVDITGPLLYTLFQERWQEVQIGHVVEGGVLELEFTQPPKLCLIYDGYLTVATEAWHIHLCLEDHLGGPHCKTPVELRQRRRIHRASLYRRLNSTGRPTSWGIQFWNGDRENMMTIFLPNPCLTADEDLLPYNKADLSKLALYEELREIYVLGNRPIPFNSNPLKRPYLSVCRSSRCYPSRQWQPIYQALQTAVNQAELEVDVITSGCLEVCKQGPVVFYSGDRTWYTRVTPEVAEKIVAQHLGQGQQLTEHLYPPVKSKSNQE